MQHIRAWPNIDGLGCVGLELGNSATPAYLRHAQCILASMGLDSIRNLS
jgi:hypothetical protein